jgi:drug/metabolite transporter (DMT)-like permease
VSPVAGVIGAGVPVVYGAFVHGLPSVPQMAGFGFALAGIWLVARSPSPKQSGDYRQGLGLAVAAGLGFGAFFIFIVQVPGTDIFAPLIVTKLSAISVAGVVLAVNRLKLPPVRGNSIGLLSGVLDSGANALFLLAKQFTRMDVAAVLASLYPAVTVLLARAILKEEISRSQAYGAVLCMLAIVLIAV